MLAVTTENRQNVDWRPYGDPVAVLLRLHV